MIVPVLPLPALQWTTTMFQESSTNESTYLADIHTCCYRFQTVNVSVVNDDLPKNKTCIGETFVNYKVSLIDYKLYNAYNAFHLSTLIHHLTCFYTQFLTLLLDKTQL